MTVRVLFFAQARERTGRASTTLDLPPEARVADALAALERLHPGLAELRPHLAVAVNQRLASMDAVIPAEAELALLPPVSGGAPALGATRRDATGRPRRDRSPARAKRNGTKPAFQVVPATAKRWADLERLFGPRGACAGCWCMWPRLPAADFRAGAGPGNKRRLRRLVVQGPPPGLIGYVGKEPAAWCALAPRQAYARIERSRILLPVDDRPVWSVVCFFVARPHRRRGLTVRMLQEAVRHARGRGASILEGYPVEPAAGKTADAFAWWGLADAFRAAGFSEVARRSATRPIMRRTLRGRG